MGDQIARLYAITDAQELYSFIAPEGRFQWVAQLACPSTSWPYSMAVRRNGTAVSLFADGNLFEIDPKRASCRPTSFAPATLRGRRFGMGYVTDPDGSETLYTALTAGAADSKTTLGYLASDYQLHEIGPITPPLARAELTGDSTGRLFAFSPSTSGDGVADLVELDRSNGRVIAASRIPLPPQDEYTFAFAKWLGDFWLFRSSPSAGPGDPSSRLETVVWRFRPSDGSLVRVTMTGAAEHVAIIAGVGLSGCLPP